MNKRIGLGLTGLMEDFVDHKHVERSSHKNTIHIRLVVKSTKFLLQNADFMVESMGGIG